ncbi:MAG: TPM domain-containing protein [Chitinophagaceae bacterium]|nr:MAG: TPM domain-containing protein [Chitinophagaceae bacterium]
MGFHPIIFLFSFLSMLFTSLPGNLLAQDPPKREPAVYDAGPEGKRARALYRMSLRNAPPLLATGVNDWEKVLSKQQVASLDSMVVLLKQATGIQVYILTLDSISTTPERIDDLVARLAHRIGIGKTEKGTQLLLGCSLALNRTFIESGYGTDKLLADIRKDEIQQSMKETSLKEGIYHCLKASLEAITSELASHP